jgi:succinoglycan biosynthesis protein ExoA
MPLITADGDTMVVEEASGSGDVAIVIPVLNEARHIGVVLQAMRPQERSRVRQLIVVDGGSTDSTRDIVLQAAKQDSRISLLPNPKRLQSAAMNLAAAAASPAVRFLVRVDAHAGYPPDFVSDLLTAQAQSEAQSVVNRLYSKGTSCFQRAVAAASNSKFGTGGAAHRIGSKDGFVDHGHHALFDRDWFIKAGGYDETFSANEDAEFDVRLRQEGGKIWFTSGAVVEYYPRDSVRALSRQYYRYGAGRARTTRKHAERLRLRQVIPPLLTIILLLSVLLGIFWPPLLVVPAAYLLGVGFATMLLWSRTKDLCVLGSMVALPVMHLSWGCGFLRQMLFGKSIRR